MRDCGRAVESRSHPNRESHNTLPRTPVDPLNERVDLLLHIGAGKTGTSSIQHFLSRNRSRLAELGTLVPREPGALRHDQLGLSIKSDTALATRLKWRQMGLASPAEFRRDFRKRLATEIGGSGLTRVLMSDEGVYASSADALERLHELVNEIARSLRIIVYLRRQDDHLCSRYQQSVKTGCVQRLSEWAQDDMSWLYDYATRLHRFERRLAPADLVVRRFEKGHFAGDRSFRTSSTQSESTFAPRTSCRSPTATRVSMRRAWSSCDCSISSVSRTRLRHLG